MKFDHRRGVATIAIITCLALVISIFGKPQHAQAVEKPFDSAFHMKADPVTSYYADYLGNNTLEDGRIWTDKSVSAGSITYYDSDGKPLTTIESAKDNFVVSLSALGQSYNLASVQVPVDAVFVIDLSSSMSAYDMAGNTGAPAGTTRDYLLVNALNSAIKSVMEANPENRISVVGYAGSNTYRFLNLDHYELSGANYFSITLTGSTHYLNVNSALIGGAGTIAQAAVSGGTPTQLGIAAGAQILTNNADTEYQFTRPNGEEDSITRKPTMILMTDGDPTFGWLNFTMQGETGASYTAGNGNPGAGDIGTDLTTILTASYWKDRIQDHYYPGHDQAPSIYTLGVGVTGVHAPSVMDPVNKAAANSFTFQGTTYNLKTLLDAFISTETTSSVPQISFPMNNRGSNTVWQLVNLTNTDRMITSYAYTDGYYSADSEDALNDAFNSIAQSIVTKGGYVTLPGEDPEFSGYLTMIDPLGKYMEFRESKGIFVNGELWQGANFARLISPGATLPGGGENTHFSNYRRVLAAHVGISETDAQELMESALAAKKIFYNSDSDFANSIMWYADSHMKYVGNFFSADGTPLEQPAGATCSIDLRGWYLDMPAYITEKPANLSNTFMTITTALEAGNFDLSNDQLDSPMIEGQQALRWYIPASLLPVRTVSYQPDPDNPGSSTVIADQVLPIKFAFTVGLKKNFDPTELSDAYKKQFATPDGSGYYFYSNEWSGDPSKEIIDTAEASFTPHEENPYYFYVEDTDLFIKQGENYVAATELNDSDTYYTREEYFDQDVDEYFSFQYLPVDRSVTDIAVRANGVPFVEAGQPKAHPVSRLLKEENTTQTNEYLSYAEFGSRRQDGPYAITHYLGNNGRLTIPVVPLEMQKQWEGDALDQVWVQLYRNGMPYRAPVELDEAGSWKSTITDLLSFATTVNAEGNVASFTYTIVEGTYVDGTFSPYDPENPLQGYDVSYTQPEWNTEYTTLSPAVVHNVQHSEGGNGGNGGNNGNGGNGGDNNNGGNGGDGTGGDQENGGGTGNGGTGTVDDGKGSTTIPRTGDGFPGLLGATLLLISAGILIFMCVRARRKKHRVSN